MHMTRALSHEKKESIFDMVDDVEFYEIHFTYLSTRLAFYLLLSRVELDMLYVSKRGQSYQSAPWKRTVHSRVFPLSQEENLKMDHWDLRFESYWFYEKMEFDEIACLPSDQNNTYGISSTEIFHMSDKKWKNMDGAGGGFYDP